MNGDVSETKNGGNVSQTNASNIWQTMVKTVRDVDTHKIDDTKEDIDTLLVFAGLFSAVVTTFVVATYPSLTPDNTDELVFLMRQSLAQNYTFVDGVLRPMVPFPDDPPFEVPLWALRVNGLWFASLIVSLSTASFGMLVKQWLVEYVAMEQWISPQEQLRARQYRHPGLEHWRVFEIAALLPLLLHISLGLFFLGLCFYTTAANDTIGRSTFPLVAGWAFFALLTFLAPLASPRCPYKVTLLKAGLRAGRRYITSRFWKPGRAAMDGTVSAAKWIWWNVVCLPYRGYRAFMRGWTRLVDVTLDISVILWIPVFGLFLPFLLFHLAVFYVAEFVRAVVSDPGTDELEEGDIMRKPYKTHELLLSVDEVIINDGPILETMAEVLKQTHTSAHNISAFVLGCIQHRIGTANRDRWIPNINEHVQGLLDLRTLSEDAWDLLAGLMGDTLYYYLPDTGLAVSVEPGSSTLWMANAAAVLLADSQWPVPEHLYLMLTEPSTLARVLQLTRLLIAHWSVRDVLHIIWVAVTIPNRGSGTITPELRKQWDQLPTLRDRNARELQTAIAQILLEHAWREDDEEPMSCSAEALLMLLYIFDTGLPFSADNLQRGISLPQSFYEARAIPDVEAALYLLPPNFVEIASPLHSVVGQSPTMITSALNLYASLLSRELATFNPEPLWTVIQPMQSEEVRADVHQLAMGDLWRFLLLCARSVPPGGGDYLQTHDFVKTCLVLARAGVPRAFGRDNPARDWTELVPVLEKTADEGTLIESVTFTTAAAREETIPTLAHRALEELQPDGHDVPERLITVLTRLAGKGPRPPPKHSAPPLERREEGILGTGIRLPFSMSGGGRHNPAATIIIPPTMGSPRSGSRHPAAPVTIVVNRSRSPSAESARIFVHDMRGRRRSGSVDLEDGPPIIIRAGSSRRPSTLPTGSPTVVHMPPEVPSTAPSSHFIPPDWAGPPPVVVASPVPVVPTYATMSSVRPMSPPEPTRIVVQPRASTTSVPSAPPSVNIPLPPPGPSRRPSIHVQPPRTSSSGRPEPVTIHRYSEGPAPATRSVETRLPSEDIPARSPFAERSTSSGFYRTRSATTESSPPTPRPYSHRPSISRPVAPSATPSRDGSIEASRPSGIDVSRTGSVRSRHTPAPEPTADSEYDTSRRPPRPSVATPPPERVVRRTGHRSRSRRYEADEPPMSQTVPPHRSRSASQAPSSYPLADDQT
ncbi:hypothetical protein PsYK624_115950 [Phanerochaete sordida]|uniref:DUF6535 domain-containing protein n=1 Tax=Phanerochaete sordida TaxID=48140 RepID=A0A9P3LHC9_9APHY|nr:hypothetical protein PsYK624_115950 [Phanerochaete sordida]